MDYQDAKDMLGGRESRKVANNTYLRMEAVSIVLQLHGHDIIRWNEDGTWEVYTCGYKTHTTKERINKFSPIQVFQKDFQWYICGAPDSGPTVKWEWDAINNMQLEELREKEHNRLM